MKALRTVRLATIVGTSLLCGPSPLLHAAEVKPSGIKRWTFDTDPAGKAPSGFLFGKTGSGRPGAWVIRAERGAPSGANVLAQVDADTTDYRFPVALANEPILRDVRLSVKCKPVSGAVDQACGLVFRYQDQDNYYITRANALENNIRLYHVVKGARSQFAGWNGPVKAGVWHELKVEAQGDHLLVFWDGRKIIDAHNQTFSQAGQVGVWTKADSITYFDDLRVEPLEP